MAKNQNLRFTKVNPDYCPPVRGEKIRARHLVEVNVHFLEEQQEIHSVIFVPGAEYDPDPRTPVVLTEVCRNCGQTTAVSFDWKYL